MLHSLGLPACVLFLSAVARGAGHSCLRACRCSFALLAALHAASHHAECLPSSICCRCAATSLAPNLASGIGDGWRHAATFQNAADDDAASAATLLDTPSVSRWTSSLQFLR